MLTSNVLNPIESTPIAPAPAPAYDPVGDIEFRVSRFRASAAPYSSALPDVACQRAVRDQRDGSREAFETAATEAREIAERTAAFNADVQAYRASRSGEIRDAADDALNGPPSIFTRLLRSLKPRSPLTDDAIAETGRRLDTALRAAITRVEQTGADWIASEVTALRGRHAVKKFNAEDALAPHRDCVVEIYRVEGVLTAAGCPDLPAFTKLDAWPPIASEVDDALRRNPHRAQHAEMVRAMLEAEGLVGRENGR